MSDKLSRQEVLLLLDELMETAPGTLRGGESLAELPAWDSLGVVSFIALADEHFGLSLPPKEIAEAKTVDDLVALVGPGLDG